MSKFIVMSHFYGICGAGFDTKTTHHAAPSAVVPTLDAPASVLSDVNIDFDEVVGAFFFTYPTCCATVAAIFCIVNLDCPAGTLRDVSTHMWVADGDGRTKEIFKGNTQRPKYA